MKLIIDVTSGEIKTPSAIIWERLSQLMGFKIVPKNINTILKCNRYKAREKIEIVSSIPNVE